MKQMDEWRDQYEELPIPDALDEAVRSSIARAQRQKRQQMIIRRTCATLFVTLFLWIGLLNVSSTFTTAMAKVPGFEPIVRLLSVQTISDQSETYEAHIEQVAVETETHPELSSLLNEAYLEESVQAYEQYVAEKEKLEEAGGGHLAVHQSYRVVTDAPHLWSMERQTTEIRGSSYQTVQYTTIDPEYGVVLTLPLLFKDDSYIERIESYVDETFDPALRLAYPDGTFHRVVLRPDQPFYITADGTLVIVFQPYEMTPGSEGVVEVAIPTSLLEDVLVSDRYIHS